MRYLMRSLPENSIDMIFAHEYDSHRPGYVVYLYYAINNLIKIQSIKIKTNLKQTPVNQAVKPFRVN
jgi:hypothetical protein